MQNAKKSAAELCQILCMVTIIEIVINSTSVMGIPVTMSCRYCIAFEMMLLFLIQSAVRRRTALCALHSFFVMLTDVQC